MIASLDGGTKDISLQLASSDSLHGMGDLVVSRKIEFSATRETWVGHSRDNRFSTVLIHVFPRKNESFDSVIAGFENSESSSLEKLVGHGVTPGGRAFVAFNQVNGVPIDEYLDIFTTSSVQRGELFDRVRDAILVANDAGLHHGALVKESIVISEIDGKPFPTIVGLGIQSLAFSGLSKTTDSDQIVVERILKKLEETFGRPAVLLGGTQLSASALLAGSRLGFGDGIVRPVEPVIEPMMKSMIKLVGSGLTHQAMLGLMVCFVLILTHLFIDISQTIQPPTPRLTDGVASMAHEIQNDHTQKEFASGCAPADLEGEGDEIIFQGLKADGDEKSVTHRITPQRPTASGGTGVLQAR